MGRALKQVLNQRAVIHVMALVRCVCNKAFLPFSKPVLPVVVKVLLLKIHVIVVMAVGLKSTRKHYPLKSRLGLIPVIEFAYAERVKPAQWVAQRATYTCKWMLENTRYSNVMAQICTVTYLLALLMPH